MKILLNIDEILKKAAAWDFTVTIGGVEYQTREASIAELNAMKSFSDENKLDELLTMLEGLFTTPPKLRWNISLVSVFIRGYIEYFTRFLEEKTAVATDAGKLASEHVRDQISKATSDQHS